MRSDTVLRSKYVIGSGPLLDWAMAAWAEADAGLSLIRLDIGQDRAHAFDLSALDGLSPADATAFVAWGPQFLNFRRLELMGECKSRGFRMPPLVCRGAFVSTSATVGDNCSVGAGSVVGPGCRIAFNSVLGQHCSLGFGVQIGSSAWVADDVRIGAGAKVGANATLGRGALVADGVVLGKQSMLDIPGRRDHALADKTFLLPSFAGAISVIDHGKP